MSLIMCTTTSNIATPSNDNNNNKNITNNNESDKGPVTIYRYVTGGGCYLEMFLCVVNLINSHILDVQLPHSIVWKNLQGIHIT